MNFKELLDKYKNGTATVEEEKLVEEEIEKFESMEEYLSEGFDMDFRAPSKEESNNKETINLKKSVNKRLRKVVITSVSTVLLILLSVFYIVSPIVDNIYYNPSKVSLGKDLKDFYFDLRVFTELNLPGYAIGGGVISESLGFGEYNIYFDRINTFTRETDSISAKIKRNMRIGSHEDFYGDIMHSYGFQIIRDPNLDEISYFKNQKERVLDHIKQLNPVSYVSAYVTFEDDLSMEDFNELVYKYSNINFKWVGVRTSPQDEVARFITGFNPDPNNGSVGSDNPDSERYPYLQLMDWMSPTNLNNRHGMKKGYEQHYMSLLRFMADRESAVKSLEGNPYKSSYYQSALEYVEENGVNTFGVLIYADAKDFIEFVESENTRSVELDRVLASRRYIN